MFSAEKNWTIFTKIADSNKYWVTYSVEVLFNQKKKTIKNFNTHMCYNEICLNNMILKYKKGQETKNLQRYDSTTNV